jgi:hypothetical protein
VKTTEPEHSAGDLEWQRLTKERMDDAAALNWARYRNDTFYMAEFLKKQGRLEEALVTYLELCYIDLNGPQNRGKFRDPGIPNFDPAKSFGLPPGIVKRIQIAARVLGYDEARTEVEFTAMASVVHRSLKLPVTPEDAWTSIRAELYRG